MEINARNMLKGKAKSITLSAVSPEIVVELPGGNEGVSIITKNSTENLDLALRKEVYAIVKASNVMIAVD